MTIFEETLKMIQDYLSSQSAPASIWENIVNYAVPIIQLVVIVAGAFAGLYKYYKTKNQEIYQQLLKKVYAPLYKYLQTQEILRIMIKSAPSVEESPIMEYKTIRISPDGREEEFFKMGLCRQEFIKMLDDIDIGLASEEIITLLNTYKVLQELSNVNDKNDFRYSDLDKMIKNVEKK